MLDPTLAQSYSENEVIRCIHIGLLCVQEDPEDRPTMKTIVLMFNSYSVTLPVPQKPAFYNRTEEDMPSMGLKFNQSASIGFRVSINEASDRDCKISVVSRCSENAATICLWAENCPGNSRYSGQFRFAVFLKRC